MERSGAVPLAALAQGLVAALLAGGLWLATVAAGGFHFSPDSMSYAALGHGFSTGHPFVGTILWLGARPGRLQANWPPLYPALIAAVHAFGPSLQWSEFLLSGLTNAAAVLFGVSAVRRACGTCPWWAIPVLAGTAWGLLVAGFGWTEPVCLALLGLHYWLAAWAMQTAAQRRTMPLLLLCGQGLAVGLAYLDRYAAAPFLLTALLLPLALAVGCRGRRLRPLLAGTTAAGLGVALPVVPWSLAALALTGHLGTPYLPVGAGLHTAWHHTVLTVRGALAQTVSSPGARPAVAHATEQHLLVATGICFAVALVVDVVRRRPQAAAPAAFAPALLALMLAIDAAAYTAVLVEMRAHYFFDAIGLRLLAPALYPALLALVVGAACVPWRWTREALLLPVGLLILLHGVPVARAGWHHPRIVASLSGPWCSAGPRGDCALFGWLQQHTSDADLIIGNGRSPSTSNSVAQRKRSRPTRTTPWPQSPTSAAGPPTGTRCTPMVACWWPSTRPQDPSAPQVSGTGP